MVHELYNHLPYTLYQNSSSFGILEHGRIIPTFSSPSSSTWVWKSTHSEWLWNHLRLVFVSAMLSSCLEIQRQSSGSHSVALADLAHRDPPASASWVCYWTCVPPPRRTLFLNLFPLSYQSQEIDPWTQYGTWWYILRFQNCPGYLLRTCLSALESGPLVVLMCNHLLAFRVCRLPSTKRRLFSLLYIFILVTHHL